MGQLIKYTLYHCFFFSSVWWPFWIFAIFRKMLKIYYLAADGYMDSRPTWTGKAELERPDSWGVGEARTLYSDLLLNRMNLSYLWILSPGMGKKRKQTLGETENTTFRFIFLSPLRPNMTRKLEWTSVWLSRHENKKDRWTLSSPPHLSLNREGR